MNEILWKGIVVCKNTLVPSIHMTVFFAIITSDYEIHQNWMPHHQNGRSHQHLDTDRYKITPHLLALMSLFLHLILTMAPFPGHLGMRQCSNFMRHVSVHCTPKTELVIHALCVLSMYILYTVNRIVSLPVLYPAFAGTDD